MTDKQRGKHLRELRKRKGIVAKFVAAKIHVSQQYLSMLENGERHWTEELVAKFMAAIGESV